MRYWLIWNLAVVSAGLVWLIDIELSRVAREPLALTAPHRSAVPTASDPAPKSSSSLTPGFVATSLARPLFSPNRHPPYAAAAAGALDSSLPRLTAILVGPTGRTAIFAGGSKPVVVVEGGHVGNFMVSSIEPDRVTMIGPDGPRLVRTSFGESGLAPPSPQPPVSPMLPPPAVLGQPTAALIASPPAGVRLAPFIPEAPKDAMPFDSNPNPSGLDIFRHVAPVAQ